MSEFMLILLFGGAAVLIGLLLSGSTQRSARHPQHADGTTSKRYEYRSHHVRHPFTFNLVKQSDGEVRIYILDGPSYGSRATDGHSTHRYFDHGNRPYVCIEQRLRPTNLHDARSWARYWADKTAQYVKTGRPFS